MNTFAVSLPVEITIRFPESRETGGMFNRISGGFGWIRASRLAMIILHTIVHPNAYAF